MSQRSPQIIDPTLLPELETNGSANVLVTLAAGGSTSSAEVRRVLGRHFLTSGYSSIADGPAATQPWPAGTGDRLVSYYSHLRVMAGTVDAEGLAGLLANGLVGTIGGVPTIESVPPPPIEPDGECASATWGIEALQVPTLWRGGLTGRGIVIGHIDTGVDPTHPAFRGAVKAFVAFDDQGKVRSDLRTPFDSDPDGHGTHTAGTLVGRATTDGCIGVAPGAKLASAIAIHGGNAFARILGGINWAIGQGVRVINLSLELRGRETSLIPIFKILQARQILAVVAIGNYGEGKSSSPGNYLQALSVGAVDTKGQVAHFSSSERFSTPERLVPDLLAPGVDIKSAHPDGGFVIMSGTSVAAAHVSGVAALLIEARPDAPVADVRTAMLRSCHPLPHDALGRSSHGVLDAVRALKRLL